MLSYAGRPCERRARRGDGPGNSGCGVPPAVPHRALWQCHWQGRRDHQAAACRHRRPHPRRGGGTTAAPLACRAHTRPRAWRACPSAREGSAKQDGTCCASAHGRMATHAAESTCAPMGTRERLMAGSLWPSINTTVFDKALALMQHAPKSRERRNTPGLRSIVQVRAQTSPAPTWFPQTPWWRGARGWTAERSQPALPCLR